MNHPLQLSPWRRCGLRASAALLLVCGFSVPLSAAVQTAKPTPSPTARASRADTASHEVRHQQAKPLNASERSPHRASKDHLYVDYDQPERSQSASSQLRMAAAAAETCDVSAFAAASGSTLVSLVRSSSVDGCINTLFGLSGSNAGQVFREAKMVTIADALRNDAVNYAGNNNSGTLQLILFLRAGYYVQYGAPSDVGTYGTALKNAIRPALDAFVANSHFRDVNEAHGAVLAEFVTLIDSSGENARQLNTVKGILDRYNSSYHAYWYMMSATNNVFTVLFRGHYNADFVSLVQSDASITTSLSGFLSRNAAEAGTSNEYLLTNASREMGRFLQYTSMRPTVKPLVRDILNRYSMSGTGAGIWVGTADVADYYLPSECAYFNICNFRTQLAQTALPITHQCSSTLRVRAQSLTSSQLADVCSKLAGQDAFFHEKLNTGKRPVANDNNTALELVIFHSSDDYSTYAGVLYGIDTNNGGMYLEGNPATTGNQARFIAYEAEWLRPAFEVWNLTHEYVHYLDGRFNMHGDFGASMSQATVWWIEGLAEYVSYSYRQQAYPEAVSAAGTRQFPLSTIFANDYNSGTARVYRWGYLAARYMFEKRPAQVTAILGYFRPGNYTGYASYMNSIRTANDSDWNQWLGCLSTNQGNTSTCGGTTTPPDPTNPTNPTDPTNPTNPPDPTDPNPPANLPECSDASQLKDGCRVSNVAATRAGDSKYFYVWVPAGTSSLQITTTSGTGNADLYVSGATWPSTSNYQHRSNGANNAEKVSLTPAAAGGYYYIAVVATTPFSGLSISAKVGTGTTTPDTPVTNLPSCTGADGVMGASCQRSNQQATRAGDMNYYYLWVPAGTTKLRVRTHSGTGNADLYVSSSNWPSTSTYERRSVTSGNAETVEIASPAGGKYYYIAVSATTPYSGLTVSTELNP